MFNKTPPLVPVPGAWAFIGPLPDDFSGARQYGPKACFFLDRELTPEEVEDREHRLGNVVSFIHPAHFRAKEEFR